MDNNTVRSLPFRLNYDSVELKAWIDKDGIDQVVDTIQASVLKTIEEIANPTD